MLLTSIGKSNHRIPDMGSVEWSYGGEYTTDSQQVQRDRDPFACRRPLIFTFTNLRLSSARQMRDDPEHPAVRCAVRADCEPQLRHSR